VVDRGLAAEVPEDTVIHRTRAATGPGLLALAGRRRSGLRAGAGEPVRSSRTFGWLRRLSSFFLVPDAYAGWFPFALGRARSRLNQGDIDVLMTTSSPDTAHLVGLVLRERLPVPWVADFRDPWVRRLTFRAPTRLHLALHTRLERRVLERADRVVVTNEATRDDFLARHDGIPDDRFAVIPNGFDPEDLEFMRDLLREKGERGRAAGRFVLAHTGLLSGKRTLGPLVDGLARLAGERPELRQRILVRQVGPRESVNDELVAAAGLADMFQFAPPASHEEILAEMAAADALVLLESAVPEGSLITPGKIFEYLASGRPILALVPEGPAAELVRAAAAGEVAPPADAARIAAVVARWLDEGPPVPASTEDTLAPYARPELARRLALVLEELAAARSRTFRPW
jgi:glycosyltransferase involved in cell wall biosynthesis